MAGKIFQIQDGLSQRAREFPELAKGFFSVDSVSTENILNMMKAYAREHGSPHFFDDVDVSEVVSMMNGEADGQTDPAVALYAICAKLMGRVQQSLNELPDKRIDFYYRKILKQDNRTAEGDHAFVTVDINNDNVSCLLPKGVRFSAGKNENGETVEFESIRDTFINDVKVAKILTVSCMKGYPISQSEIPVYSPQAACEQNLLPYPLFGLTRSNEMPEGTSFSNVGVCVSNRIFCMSSGIRNVKVNFVFSKESLRRTVLEKSFENISGFSAAFTNAFGISLTAENGWLDIEDYKIGCGNLDPECPENEISLEFSIKDTDPAIINYDREIHGGLFECENPVLRILVIPRRSRALWLALQKLKLQSVRIAVDVSKCRDIVVSNEYGPASTLLPVQPFGAMPSVGSSFIVGCKEICGKKLDAFEVHGKWCGLPNCKNFSEWYAQYDNPPQTSDYVVSLSGLYGGTWLPSEENSVTCNLFETVNGISRNWIFDSDKDECISPEFKISFNKIVGSRVSEIIPEDENFMYSPMMKDGFFKMKLVAPSRAFMHQEMSRAVCNSFLSQVLKKKKADDLPNQPYTPSIEDLYVDYSSDTEILFSTNSLQKTDGIFFVHPFGFSLSEPFFLHSGALYLGLKYAGKPKRVNLYFMLNRDSATRSIESGKYTWSYLGALGWKPLPDEKRLADSTAYFTTSGIVTLSLPNDMVSESTLMPSGYFWIRITPNGESWRECSRLLSVFTQSLEVRRVCGFKNGDIMSHCEPQSITELKTSIAGLSNVFQFEESFGGKPRESDSKMRMRVAEFLYHRNRSICIEDYERMILERFPEVHKVKCFPHMCVDESSGRYDSSCPGNLLVVPVSPMFNDGTFQWDPCLSGSVLWSIRRFLQKQISQKVNVQVMNPFFDKLQVRCNVKFRHSENEGEILLDLNKKINRYLSPWFTKSGGITRHFGWNIDKSELKAYIESLDYVDSVGDDFTIMKVASTDEQKFLVNLFESSDDRLLRGSFPWSIAVPMRRHFINDVDSKDKSSMNGVNNGYGGLEIGQTFIIRNK